MSLRTQIGLVFLAPVLLAGGAYALGVTIPAAYLDRDYVLRMVLPDAGHPVDLPHVYGPDDKSRPLLVIDPGHGGKDPGASNTNYREKDLVLALARALRDQLVEEGGIRIALTRDGDKFLVLQERFEIARRLDADLFLSIHADATSEGSDAAGASIYTLSNTASSEAAARFAARENRSDEVNGIALEDNSANVNAILVELSQRRVQQDSAEFAGLVVREGAGTLKFHTQPRKSAALAVLRAPDVPSILYESGYINNPQDAAWLESATGRKIFAETMARAVRIYFARQTGT